MREVHGIAYACLEYGQREDEWGTDPVTRVICGSKRRALPTISPQSTDSMLCPRYNLFGQTATTSLEGFKIRRRY